MESAHAVGNDSAHCICGWKPSTEQLAQHGGKSFALVALHVGLSKLSLGD